MIIEFIFGLIINIIIIIGIFFIPNIILHEIAHKVALLYFGINSTIYWNFLIRPHTKPTSLQYSVLKQFFVILAGPLSTLVIGIITIILFSSNLTNNLLPQSLQDIFSITIIVLPFQVLLLFGLILLIPLNDYYLLKIMWEESKLNTDYWKMSVEDSDAMLKSKYSDFKESQKKLAKKYGI